MTNNYSVVFFLHHKGPKSVRVTQAWLWFVQNNNFYKLKSTLVLWKKGKCLLKSVIYVLKRIRDGFSRLKFTSNKNNTHIFG